MHNGGPCQFIILLLLLTQRPLNRHRHRQPTRIRLSHVNLPTRGLYSPCVRTGESISPCRKVRLPYPHSSPSCNIISFDWHYGVEMVESGVKTISRPVIDRRPSPISASSMAISTSTSHPHQTEIGADQNKKRRRWMGELSMMKMGLISPPPPLQPFRDNQRRDHQDPVGETANRVYPVGFEVRFAHNKSIPKDLPFLIMSLPNSKQPVCGTAFTAA